MSYAAIYATGAVVQVRNTARSQHGHNTFAAGVTAGTLRPWGGPANLCTEAKSEGYDWITRVRRRRQSSSGGRARHRHRRGLLDPVPRRAGDGVAAGHAVRGRRVGGVVR